MSRSESQPKLRSGLPRTITVTVPIQFEKRGGRKTVINPSPYVAPPPKYDNALVKAIARAHRWRRTIESGKYSSITELAKAEKVNQSYACRVLRLTLLAPTIVEMILNGRQPRELQLSQLLQPLPPDWRSQAQKLGLDYPLEAQL